MIGITTQPAHFSKSSIFFKDDFERADGAVGNGWTAQSYGGRTGTFNITSGKAYPTASGGDFNGSNCNGMFFYQPLPTGNFIASAKLSAVGAPWLRMLMVRESLASNSRLYRVDRNGSGSNTVNLARVTTGTVPIFYGTNGSTHLTGWIRLEFKDGVISFRDKDYNYIHSLTIPWVPSFVGFTAIDSNTLAWDDFEIKHI